MQNKSFTSDLRILDPTVSRNVKITKHKINRIIVTSIRNCYMLLLLCHCMLVKVGTFLGTLKSKTIVKQ